MTLLWLLVQFVVCAGLIARAGFVLSRNADRLAGIYGWGRSWVGLALLATVTSMPELTAGVSAVAWVDAPNLAVGDVLGSCVFNLVFLVIVDALQRHQPMYLEASATHLLSAAFGVVMLGFVAMGLMLAQAAPRLLHVGVYSPVMLGLYFVALAAVSRHEPAPKPAPPPPPEHQAQSQPEPQPQPQPAAAPVPGGAAEGTANAPSQAAGAEPPDGTRALWRGFGLAALTVVLAGGWLPVVADGLASATGMSRSFVGTLWLAFATSLPEIAVTLAALRLRALDLAMANLLGSNLFNIVVLAVDDAAYLRGPLLSDAAPVHAATAMAAVVMTGLVMVGLLMRPRGRVLRVMSWISIGLVAIYMLNAALVYLHGA